MANRTTFDLDGEEDHRDDLSMSSKSTVSFGSVQVREYERVIDTSKYMGLTLGWGYHDQPASRLQDSQDDSSGSGMMSTERRRKLEAEKVHKMHNGERFEVFLTYGFTRKQLKAATDEAARMISQQQKEAARQLVLQEKAKKNKGNGQPKRRLLRSLF